MTTNADHRADQTTSAARSWVGRCFSILNIRTDRGPLVDQTHLNLASVVIGGAGIFAALVKYSVPELNNSFLGANPFEIKRNEIDKILTLVFVFVALVGLLVQVGLQIYGFALKKRPRGSSHYLGFTALLLVMTYASVQALVGIGHGIARWRWEPKIVEGQLVAFERARFIVEHDGWTPEHYPVRESLITEGREDRYKSNNREVLERDLQQMEDLFEIDTAPTSRERIENLAVFFYQD